jgi:hypothetical protein
MKTSETGYEQRRFQLTENARHAAPNSEQLITRAIGLPSRQNRYNSQAKKLQQPAQCCETPDHPDNRYRRYPQFKRHRLQFEIALP